MTDEEIIQRALEFARAHKKEIASRLTDTKQFPPDEIPISVFMAGSPGAGKTESARNLIARFSKDRGILHIDVDELRKEFKEYTGTNSSLFQGATSIIADRMHDSALDQKQSFVFDGTLTNMLRARENFARSLKRNRSVFIVYVYQDPLQAWRFVEARKLKDGRVVPIEAFVRQYFEARENVNKLKHEFVEKIQVDVIVKNLDGTDLGYFENVDVIDRHLAEKYSKETLQAILQTNI